MWSSPLWVLLFASIAFLLNNLVSAEYRKRGTSPLPVFTKVETKHEEESNTTSITVQYDANEQPHFQWFVDDVPYLGNKSGSDLSSQEGGETDSGTSVSVPDSLGTRYSVCLQTSKARTCLHLRPLNFKIFNGIGESVDFPWPLLIPAPRARYNSGENTTIFASELDASTYAYSGRFIFAETSKVDQSLQLGQSASHGMTGGQAGDLVTLTPVTSGSRGWMVEVATGAEGYEGILMFQTTFTPPRWYSELVEKVVTTRPINIYNREHSGPFPSNFIVMPTRVGQDVHVTCRAQDTLPCLISCPFAINGDVGETTTTLMRVHRGLVDLSYGHVWKLGDYWAEARFVVDGPKETSDDFQCWVSLDGNTVASHITMNWI